MEQNRKKPNEAAIKHFKSALFNTLIVSGILVIIAIIIVYVYSWKYSLFFIPPLIAALGGIISYQMEIRRLKKERNET